MTLTATERTTAVRVVPVTVAAVLAFVVACLRYGIHGQPYVEINASLAINPFAAHAAFPRAWASPLGMVVAGMVDATTSDRYVALHFVILVAAFAVSVLAVAQYVSDRAAKLFVVAWFASPLSNIELTWLGKPDPLTMMSATLLTVAPTPVAFAAGALVGFNHFEQGAFIVLAVGVMRVRFLRHGWLEVVAGVGGLVVGKAVLTATQVAVGANTGGRVGFVGDRGLSDILATNAAELPVGLWSMYSLLWLPLIAAVAWMTARDRWWVLGLHAVLFAAVMITVDFTRVWALVSWPVVVFLAARWSTVRFDERWLWAFIAAAVIIPRVYVWDGALFVGPTW